MSTSKNTKTLYNSNIPDDWEVKKLSECCLIKGEYGINAAAVEYSDDLPTYIRITDIDDDGNYSVTKKASVNDENSSSFILRKGDIVFARTGATVGKTYLYDEKDGELVFAGFLIRFRPNENILLTEHLRNFTLTKSYWDWVKTVSMRSGQPGINAEEYGSLKLPLPPLPEQKAIAHILSLMDTAINKNNLLIAKKELQKKWLMQNLLAGKKRLKGFEKEKWKRLGAGEIFESITVKGFDSEELLSATQDRGMIPRTMLVGRVTMPTSGTESFKLVEKGDFVISLRSFQGGLEYSYYRGLVSPAYTVLKPKKKINDEFYKSYFKSYDFIGHLAVAVIGIRDGKQISYEDFCFVRIPLPSFEEQTAIAQVLQAADKEIQLLKIKTAKLREQKKGMMQVLLTGKKRLKIDNE
jgi:type I restriction enzyme, S subunit